MANGTIVKEVEECQSIPVYTSTTRFTITHNSSFRCGRYVHVEINATLSGAIPENEPLAEIRTALPSSIIRGFVNFNTTSTSGGGMSTNLDTDGKMYQRMVGNTPTSGELYLKFDYYV